LSKVMILLGPRWADLPANRHHGATYDVFGKDSQNLLTEEIRIKSNGALPLLYETLTGIPVTAPRSLKMRDVYPYISEVTTEYKLATGSDALLGKLEIKAIQEKVPGLFHLEALAKPLGENVIQSVLRFPALRGWKKIPGSKNKYRSHSFPATGETMGTVVRTQIDTRFFYIDPSANRTTLCGQAFPMTEELPIFILFFHLSNVVRYKPEFLEKLQESQFWPFVLTAKRHCLFRFILLFWSWVHQKTYLIEQK